MELRAQLLRSPHIVSLISLFLFLFYLFQFLVVLLFELFFNCRLLLFSVSLSNTMPLFIK